MKRFLSLFIIVFLIGVVSASQPWLPDPVMKRECVELPQTCASCSYNNITTIVKPDGIEDIYSSMTKNGDNFNYTYCNTNIVGNYYVNGIGDLDGADETWGFGFTVTSDGKEADSTLLSARFYIWVVILIILALAGFYCNDSLEGGESERFGILVWLGLLITGISGLIIIEDFLTLIIGGGSALLSIVMLFNILSGHYDSPRSWS